MHRTLTTFYKIGIWLLALFGLGLLVIGLTSSTEATDDIIAGMAGLLAAGALLFCHRRHSQSLLLFTICALMTTKEAIEVVGGDVWFGLIGWGALTLWIHCGIVRSFTQRNRDVQTLN